MRENGPALGLPGRGCDATVFDVISSGARNPAGFFGRLRLPQNDVKGAYGKGACVKRAFVKGDVKCRSLRDDGF